MKAILKHLITVFCALAIFVGSIEIWRYLLVDDTSSYTRIMMHQLYESPENIDVLFVGSSHVYRSFNPQITDEEFGLTTFNAGSSSQMMDASYAVIKEAAKDNDIQQIYLEMYYVIALSGEYQERTELTSTYIISDYMKPSWNRTQYLLHASSKEYWINSFVIARRDWKNFYDFLYMLGLLKTKQSEQYRNYEWMNPNPDSSEHYVDRGFVANDGVIGDEQWDALGTPTEKINVDAAQTTALDSYNSLMDIIDFCKDEGITLTLFVTPEPERKLLGKGNYQEYHDYVEEIASENGIEFYDFNLVREDYFDTDDKTLFLDDNHLNTAGAEAFSKLFGQFFTGKISAEDLFYDSFDEKMSGTQE